ncbi:flagellar export chaperone FliS [Pseudoalteromonas sp. SG45-5]|jgi:flagellar protein FliS|uniref:Flagellar secretion chaperone FliS n=2 Tax=Pseudoalteromonas aliena TaxID=247523 RepID=A0A1Q2GZK0_9GAMM|nr:MULTISPECIES: flagellar export chaperone FliS [Pseudoalteromonas]AQQ00546.1 flagellar export chaperone FliS [Pseudoalteromonas aliena]MBB1384232.1 flagellar export chaperone FliS [Pseudoalteromonas sp. SG45-5]MBB1392534.1 flagellar export chaperone FliS [Pseudoalteromonas sp. SG44-4]MBB1447602.1 flagellar export chaperone FliS [Pseudoalteromonas sp. SG41-6]MBE0360246.1 flagellar protein FliS [Pseudoalteromonas aliena SW19]
MAHASINKYRQVTVSSVKEMTPYDQVKLVFANIVGKLSAAKGFIQRKEFDKKGIAISDCITLLGALQQVLNFEGDNAVSTNLDSLYDYCQRTLLMANMENNIDKLDEVIVLIKEIKSGWEAIPLEHRS